MYILNIRVKFILLGLVHLERYLLRDHSIGLSVSVSYVYLDLCLCVSVCIMLIWEAYCYLMRSSISAEGMVAPNFL